MRKYNQNQQAAIKFAKMLSEDDIAKEDDPSDIHMENPLSSQSSTSNFRTPTTRRKTAANIAESSPEEREFPVMHIRTDRKSTNEKVIRCTVQCLSKYKVSQNDLAGIIVMTANTIFRQAWSTSTDMYEEVSSNSNSGENSEDGKTVKRRLVDHTDIFPSKKCVVEYLAGALYMNLEIVAKAIVNKQDKVVTIGIDGTTKAAGHKLYDVKADHITVQGQNIKRGMFTTGY